MGGTFNGWGALKKALQQEMHSAMSEAESNSYLDALHNNSDYYSEGEPLKQYQRTHQFENSVQTTDVVGSGDELRAEIYLDMGYNYPEGNWPTPVIFNAIEEGFGGAYAPKGKHGRWKQTLEDIEENVKEAFGKRFE